MEIAAPKSPQVADMETLRGFPCLLSLWLRQAKPGSATATGAAPPPRDPLLETARTLRAMANLAYSIRLLMGVIQISGHRS
jgi:hypothetical protein